MNIKTLGLVVAVLAMTAVMASGASAANFTASGGYPAKGSGGQTTKHVFTIQGQKVECTEATFTGTLAAASSQTTITPTYNGCTAFGFIGAKVDMNGCDYLFTVEVEHGVHWATGSVHTVCPPGSVITITAGGCVVHIPPQTPTANLIDMTDGTGILFGWNLSGIHANVTSSFPCTLSSKSTDTSGSYTGSTLFQSTEGKTIDIG